MMTEAVSRWPIHLEPKNPTMDKKLAITVCPNGALITRNQNPKQPYTPKEVAQQAIEAYREGAVELHFHARDELGYSLNDPNPYIETIELVLMECPNMIMSPSLSVPPQKAGGGLYEVETTQDMIEGLLKRGKNYMETSLLTPVSYVSTRALRPGQFEAPINTITPERLRAEAKFLQSKGIKPHFLAHDFEAIDNVREYLIEPGVLQKPYLICLGPGMHKPSTKTYPDPWGMINFINMMAVLPKDTVVGASIGGHNWLSITVLAIMLGVDYIRVGMEDAMHLYPHKDKLIDSCAQVTRKIVAIARELGREIATPDETRAIFGIQ
ncbi:MAG: 3-keto-5-aminohexanoate cleavage protein [Chloroflexi bacterium]|nr:3-keto-5-aminohexanoate cleavage protein [Chloroflexota bacterium]